MKPTLSELALFLHARFGFIAMPCKPADWLLTRPYTISERINTLWGNPTDLPIFCAGKATVEDWRMQAAAVNQKWPDFIKRQNLAAQGYEFWRLEYRP